MPCDYYTAKFLNVFYYDEEKKTDIQYRTFQRLLKKDERVYRDLYICIEKYYLKNVSEKDIFLARDGGYYYGIPHFLLEPEYEEAFDKYVKKIYLVNDIPELIYSYGDKDQKMLKILDENYIEMEEICLDLEEKNEMIIFETVRQYVERKLNIEKENILKIYFCIERYLYEDSYVL